MKKTRGHYCRICGRTRPNERFSGSGHREHVCKDCKAEDKRRRREARDQILKVVDKQIRNNDPPETLATFRRLRSEGHSERDAKKLIGRVLAAEMFEILQQKRDYDHERYVAALAALPDLPE